MKSPAPNKITLTDSDHIKRHQNFVKMCQTLKIRQKDIARWTGESKGNVSDFCNGKRPIGDSFYGKFWDAFGDRLKIEGFTPDDLWMVNDLPLQTKNRTEQADRDKEIAGYRTEIVLLRKEKQALRDIILQKFTPEELEKMLIVVSTQKDN